MNGTEPSIVGAGTINHVNELFFDFVFVGASGLSEEGFYDYSFEDTETKRALLARSNTSVALRDTYRFERMSAVLFARLEEIDILVTDRCPPEALNQALKAARSSAWNSGGA